jgi:transposase
MPAAVPSGVKARKGQIMAVVMIGVDPHKGSHTAVAVGADESPLGQVRVRASAAQAQRLLAWSAAWPERTWAVEGAGGLGHLLAQELVAAGERVLDVQPKLAARVRLLAARAVNKNDPNDARSVAVAALRSPSCLLVRADDHAAVLKIWAKRHHDLSRARNQVACRLHAALCELIPGGLAKETYADQADQLLREAEPRGAVQQARAELAAELVADLRRADELLRETKKKLATAVRASGTTLTEVFGVGPVIAATVIGDVRDVSRFASRDRFAAYNGTAPIEVSGPRPRHPPALAAREPAPEPRHPHGRDHPDPLQAQRRPRLLRQEDHRRQDAQRGAARPQAPDQRRSLQAAEGRRRPSSSQHPGPGRANGGTTLSPARSAHTPNASSSAKPLPDLPPPYDTQLTSRNRLPHASGRKIIRTT